MLKLIGLHRTIVISVLIGINLLIVMAFLGVVSPMQLDAERDLSRIKATISNLQTNIQNIKKDLAEFNETLPAYQALQTSGFISAQDRFAIGRDLEKVRELSGLKGFSYEIDDIRDLTHPSLEKAKMRLIASRIRLKNFEVVHDVPIYKFVAVLQSAFPPQVRMADFSIQQLGKIDQEGLEKIAKGENPMLVDAALEFDWITLVPLPAEDKSKTPANVTGGYR